MPEASLPPSDARLLQISPEDNIGVVTTASQPGVSLACGAVAVTLLDPVPAGHKVALVPIRKGEKVVKYGAPIGSATSDILPGQHVHTHNLRSDYLPTYTLSGTDRYLGRSEDAKE